MNEWEHIAMIWHQLENLVSVFLALIGLLAAMAFNVVPMRRREARRVIRFYETCKGKRPWDWI